MAHKHAAKDRAREANPDAEPGEHRPRAHYLDEVQGEREAMRRPERDMQRSWRQGGGPAQGGGQPRGDRGKQEAVWDRPAPAGRGGQGGERGGRGRRGPPSPRRERRQDDRQLLTSTAADINAFKNDGNFMEALRAKAEAGESLSDAKPEASPPRGTAAAEEQDGEEGYRLPPERSAADAMLSQLQAASAPDSPAPAPAPAPSPAPAPAPPRATPPSGNQSVADALRARLMGKAPPGGQGSAASPGQRAGREAVALPLVDAHGRAAPGAFGRKTAGADAVPEGNRIAKQTQR